MSETQKSDMWIHVALETAIRIVANAPRGLPGDQQIDLVAEACQLGEDLANCAEDEGWV